LQPPQLLLESEITTGGVPEREGVHSNHQTLAAPCSTRVLVAAVTGQPVGQPLNSNAISSERVCRAHSAIAACSPVEQWAPPLHVVLHQQVCQQCKSLAAHQLVSVTAGSATTYSSNISEASHAYIPDKQHLSLQLVRIQSEQGVW
jgi:hypothetical protein